MAKFHATAHQPKVNLNEEYLKSHSGRFFFDGLYLPVGSLSDRDLLVLRSIAECSMLRTFLYCFGTSDFIHLTIADFGVLIHCRERFSKYEVYYTC